MSLGLSSGRRSGRGADCSRASGLVENTGSVFREEDDIRTLEEITITAVKPDLQSCQSPIRNVLVFERGRQVDVKAVDPFGDSEV